MVYVPPPEELPEADEAVFILAAVIGDDDEASPGEIDWSQVVVDSTPVVVSVDTNQPS